MEAKYVQHELPTWYLVLQVLRMYSEFRVLPGSTGIVISTRYDILVRSTR